MMKTSVLYFLLGAATVFGLARLPQTRTFITGGNKFFG